MHTLLIMSPLMNTRKSVMSMAVFVLIGTQRPTVECSQGNCPMERSCWSAVRLDMLLWSLNLIHVMILRHSGLVLILWEQWWMLG